MLPNGYVKYYVRPRRFENTTVSVVSGRPKAAVSRDRLLRHIKTFSGA